MGGGADASGGAAPDAAAANNGQPGGGIGNPINTPDPLSKYKWWILGGLALVLTAGAGFLLRKPAGLPGATYTPEASTASLPAFTSSGLKQTSLLNALKEEMFALESEKIHGTITPEDYAEAKAALEIVLKRALKRNA